MREERDQGLVGHLLFVSLITNDDSGLRGFQTQTQEAKERINGRPGIRCLQTLARKLLEDYAR